MKRTEALETLGLSNCKTALTDEIVREAFRAKVKLIHPDMGVTPADSGTDMVKTVSARDYLLKNLTSTDDFACKLCSGVGMVSSGKMGWHKCAACHGSGERQ